MKAIIKKIRRIVVCIALGLILGFLYAIVSTEMIAMALGTIRPNSLPIGFLMMWACGVFVWTTLLLILTGD